MTKGVGQIAMLLAERVGLAGRLWLASEHFALIGLSFGARHGLPNETVP